VTINDFRLGCEAAEPQKFVRLRKFRACVFTNNSRGAF
jgi:hypothetical protein